MTSQVIATVRRRLGGAAIVPGDSPLLDEIARQLQRYFSGESLTFDLPLAPIGSGSANSMPEHCPIFSRQRPTSGKANGPWRRFRPTCRTAASRSPGRWSGR